MKRKDLSCYYLLLTTHVRLLRLHAAHAPLLIQFIMQVIIVNSWTEANEVDMLMTTLYTIYL